MNGFPSALATILIVLNGIGGILVAVSMIERLLGVQPNEDGDVVERTLRNQGLRKAIEQLEADLTQDFSDEREIRRRHQLEQLKQELAAAPDSPAVVALVVGGIGLAEIAAMTAALLISGTETAVAGLGRFGGAIAISAAWCAGSLLIGIAVGTPLGWAHASTRPEVNDRFARTNRWLLGGIAAAAVLAAVASLTSRAWRAPEQVELDLSSSRPSEAESSAAMRREMKREEAAGSRPSQAE